MMPLEMFLEFQSTGGGRTGAMASRSKNERADLVSDMVGPLMEHAFTGMSDEEKASLTAKVVESIRLLAPLRRATRVLADKVPGHRRKADSSLPVEASGRRGPDGVGSENYFPICLAPRTPRGV